MTQEDRQLLLRDLCARVAYVTFVYVDWHETEELEICEGCEDDEEEPNIHTLISCNYYGECDLDDNLVKTIYDIKPYLRPMSSMTVKEKTKIASMAWNFNKFTKSIEVCFACLPVVDYCYSRHLDIHGLIEKGLALEAPEGMYKTE